MKETSKKIINSYPQPKNSVIKFARQTEEDANLIESSSTEDLVSEWKRLVWMNCIYNQVSVSDLQRIDLIEAELRDREYPMDELSDWFVEQTQNFKEEDYL